MDSEVRVGAGRSLPLHVDACGRSEFRVVEVDGSARHGDWHLLQHGFRDQVILFLLARATIKRLICSSYQ